MEKFLEFWSHYNAAIIEALVALILFSAIYLAYRTFFGAKEVQDFAGGAASEQIEKTLQKILEQQSSSAALLEKGVTFEGAAGATAGKGAPPPEMIQELTTLKKALEDKEKQIVVLQEKASAAAKATQAEGAASIDPAALAQAAEAAAGMAEQERKEYEDKIKELEARLAEYEIISEDIADLSFFKEENQRLTRELEALRGGGPSGGDSAPPTPTEMPPAPAAPSEAAAAPAATAESEAADVIDDNLMAEFAKAVEGQKSGTLAEPAAAEGDKQLLEQFENFSKKS